jgi:hypothetical protein
MTSTRKTTNQSGKKSKKIMEEGKISHANELAE